MSPSTDDSTGQAQLSPSVKDPVHGQDASASMGKSIGASAEVVSQKPLSHQPPDPPSSQAETTNTKIPALFGGQMGLGASMHALKKTQELKSSLPPNAPNKKGPAMSGIPVKGKFGLGESIHANPKPQQPKIGSTLYHSPTQAKASNKRVAAMSGIPVKGKGLEVSIYANNKSPQSQSNSTPDRGSLRANVAVPQAAARSGVQVKKQWLLGGSQHAPKNQESQQSTPPSTPVASSPQASSTKVQTVTPSGGEVKKDRRLDGSAQRPEADKLPRPESSPVPVPVRTSQTDSSSAQGAATPGGQKKWGVLMKGGSQFAIDDKEPQQPASSSAPVPAPSQADTSNAPVSAMTNGPKKKRGRKGKSKQEPAAVEESQQRQTSPAPAPRPSQADTPDTKITSMPNDQKKKGGLFGPKSTFEPPVVEKSQNSQPEAAPAPASPEIALPNTPTVVTHDGQKNKGGLLGPKSQFTGAVVESQQPQTTQSKHDDPSAPADPLKAPLVKWSSYGVSVKETQEPQSSPSIVPPASSATPWSAPDSKASAESEPKVPPTAPAEHADSSKQSPDPQLNSSVATPLPPSTLSVAQKVMPSDEQEQTAPLVDPSPHAGSTEKLPGDQSDQSIPSSSTAVSSGVQPGAASGGSERETSVSTGSNPAVSAEELQEPQSMPSPASQPQPTTNDSSPPESEPGLESSMWAPNSQQTQQSGVSTPSQASRLPSTAKESVPSQGRPSSLEASMHAPQPLGSQQPPVTSQASILPPSFAGAPNGLPPGTPTGPKNWKPAPYRGNQRFFSPGTPPGSQFNSHRQTNAPFGAHRGPALGRNDQIFDSPGNHTGNRNRASHPKPTTPLEAPAQTASQRTKAELASPQIPTATSSTGHSQTTPPPGPATGIASGTQQPTLDSPQTPKTASSATQPQARGPSEASLGDRALTETQPAPASRTSAEPASPAFVSTSAVPGPSLPLRPNAAGYTSRGRNHNSSNRRGGRFGIVRTHIRLAFRSHFESYPHGSGYWASKGRPTRRRKVKGPAPPIIDKAALPLTATNDPEDILRLTKLRLALAQHPVRQYPIETQMVIRDMEGRKQMPASLEMQLAEFWNIKDWDEKDEDGFHVWLGHPGIPIVAGPPQAWKGHIWKVHKNLYKHRMDESSIRQQAWNAVMHEARTGNPQVKVMEDKLAKLLTIPPKQRGEEKAELIAKVERLEKQIAAASEARSVTGVRTSTNDASFSTFTKDEIVAEKDKRIARLEKDLAASRADSKLGAEALAARNEDIKSKEKALQASRIESESKDQLVQELKVKNKEYEQALSTQREALLKAQLQLKCQVTQHETKVRELSDEKEVERQAKEALTRNYNDLTTKTAELDKKWKDSREAHTNCITENDHELKREKAAHIALKEQSEEKFKTAQANHDQALKQLQTQYEQEKQAHDTSIKTLTADHEFKAAAARTKALRLENERDAANVSHDTQLEESHNLHEQLRGLERELKAEHNAREQDMKNVDYVLKQVDDSEAAQLKPLSGKIHIINEKIVELKQKADRNQVQKDRELRDLHEQLAKSKDSLQHMEEQLAAEIEKEASFKAQLQEGEDGHNVTKDQLKTVEKLAHAYANRLDSIHKSLVVYIESIVDFLPADGQHIEGNTEDLIAHLQWLYDGMQRELEDKHNQLLECQNQMEHLEKELLITGSTSPSLAHDLERHHWDYAYDNDGDNAGDHEGDGHTDDDDNHSDHTATAPCTCPCTCKAPTEPTMDEKPAEEVPHRAEIGTQTDDIIPEDSEMGTQADDSNTEGPQVDTETDDAAVDNGSNSSLPSPTDTACSLSSNIHALAIVPWKKPMVGCSTQTMPIPEGPEVDTQTNDAAVDIASNSSLPSPTNTTCSIYSGIDARFTFPVKKPMADCSTQTMPIPEKEAVVEFIIVEPAVAAKPVRSRNRFTGAAIIFGITVLIIAFGMAWVWLSSLRTLKMQEELWRAANSDTLRMLRRMSEKTVAPPPSRVGAGLMASVHATLDWMGLPP